MVLSPRNVFTFVAVGLLLLNMSASVWPHDGVQGMWIHGPVLFGGGVRGPHPLWHGGFLTSQWGYYPLYPPPSQPSSPAPSPYEFAVKPAGRLRLSVEPPSAEVFVDGAPLEPSGGSDFDVALLVGSHTIQVAKEGYQPYTSEVSVEAAKTTRLSVTLRPHGSKGR